MPSLLVREWRKQVEQHWRETPINLTKAFRTLHTSGLCYRDISFGKAFFDPATGGVLVCDNDNVGTSNATARLT